MSYKIEKYWSKVAKKIEKRKDGKFIACGKTDAYWIYHRNKFIESFRKIDMSEYFTILEVGCGPGGNLLELTQLGGGEIYGVDISEEMCRLAKGNLTNYNNVNICRIDGNTVPFKDNVMDLVFTVTVLQHVMNDEMLRNIMCEICRVSKKTIILYENIVPEYKYTSPTVDDSVVSVSRPITYYQNIMEEFGWKLIDGDFIRTRASYIIAHYPFLGWNLMCRKLKMKKIGISNLYLRTMLKITKHLDDVVNTNMGLAKMKFESI